MIGGRERDALWEIDQAHLLDPTSPIIRRVKGSVLVAARRYDDALAVCQQLLVENPTYILPMTALAMPTGEKVCTPRSSNNGVFPTVTRAIGSSLSLTMPRSGIPLGWMARRAHEGMKVLLSQRQTGYVSPYQIARFYADLGDKEKAFEWLNTAYSEHDYQLRELNTDFGMDHLRPDPRFTELVRKVGLPKVR